MHNMLNIRNIQRRVPLIISRGEITFYLCGFYLVCSADKNIDQYKYTRISMIY